MRKRNEGKNYEDKEYKKHIYHESFQRILAFEVKKSCPYADVRNLFHTLILLLRILYYSTHSPNCQGKRLPADRRTPTRNADLSHFPRTRR